jgi:hypothetical protein
MYNKCEIKNSKKTQSLKKKGAFLDVLKLTIQFQYINENFEIVFINNYLQI